MYHEGRRELQDRFDSRRIADRLEEITVHAELTDDDVAFIGRSPLFFLAIADGEGWPDVSYEGDRPGFVRGLDRERRRSRSTTRFVPPGTVPRPTCG